MWEDNSILQPAQQRRGIILVGGKATRLRPATNVVSKQLLPVYDKPMVYYPLSLLIELGISEICLISSPQALPAFRELLGNGDKFGMTLSYIEQPRPAGIAQALILAEAFLAGAPSVLALGDNLLLGEGLRDRLWPAMASMEGATVLARRVADPTAFGVIEFDASGRAVDLVEKPTRPRSSHAVPGYYFYDGQAPALARSLEPSARGELEITDLNRCYLRSGNLRAIAVDEGFSWFDAGTPDSLLAAAEAVRLAQGKELVGSPELAAFKNGWITPSELASLAGDVGPDYARQLLNACKAVKVVS